MTNFYRLKGSKGEMILIGTTHTENPEDFPKAWLNIIALYRPAKFFRESIISTMVPSFQKLFTDEQLKNLNLVITSQETPAVERFSNFEQTFFLAYALYSSGYISCKNIMVVMAQSCKQKLQALERDKVRLNQDNIVFVERANEITKKRQNLNNEIDSFIETCSESEDTMISRAEKSKLEMQLTQDLIEVQDCLTKNYKQLLEIVSTQTNIFQTLNEEAALFNQRLQEMVAEEQYLNLFKVLHSLNMQGLSIFTHYMSMYSSRPEENMDQGIRKYISAIAPKCEIIALEDAKDKVESTVISQRWQTYDSCKFQYILEQMLKLEKYSQFKTCDNKTQGDIVKLNEMKNPGVLRNFKWFPKLEKFMDLDNNQDNHDNSIICVGNNHMLGKYGLIQFCAELLSGNVYTSVTILDQEGCEYPFDAFTGCKMTLEEQTYHLLVDVIGYAS